MKEFWEQQAKTFKNSAQAVNFDPGSDDIALDLFERMLSDGETVCDLGCGNGRIVLSLAKLKKNVFFVGIDFAEEMIRVANEQKKEMGITNVEFHNLDSTSEDLKGMFSNRFEKVITKRLLINVKGEADKRKALGNIQAMLKDRGVYIMSECFMEPLRKINEIRKRLGLEEITVKFFNEYLTEGFLGVLGEKFEIEDRIDYESTYYFISRIFNAYLSKGVPDYDAPMNKLALQLAKFGVNPTQGYAPEIVYCLRKK